MKQEVSRSRQRQQHQWMLSSVANTLMLTAFLTALQQCTAAKDFFISSTSASVAAASPFAQQQHLTLVFPLKPLTRPPTPPPAYKDYPNDQWKWLGGPGYFLITKSDYGPLGALTEAWYLPGRYQPKCSSKRNIYYSAQRLWVNMEVSRQIGRQVWGFPKEMANFLWGARSITLTDSANNTIFSAQFSDELKKPSPAWPDGFAKIGLDTIQWPIVDKPAKFSSLVELQFAGDPHSRADAVIAASILPQPVITASSSASVASNGSVTPNTQHLTFTGSGPGAIVPAPGYDAVSVLRVTKLEIDSQAFTGRLGREVQLAWGLDIGFIKGTPGSLDNPAEYKC